MLTHLVMVACSTLPATLISLSVDKAIATSSATAAALDKLGNLVA
jgi:hypothetical protein